MPTDKAPVTAQDFIDIVTALSYEPGDMQREFPKLLSRARQQAFSAGRLQGLKEMDEANKRIWDEKSTDSIVAMEDLRSEYQKPN